MIITRKLGCQDYSLVLHEMKQFTQLRDTSTPDEVWLVEHPAVYTQGQAGKREHILNPGSIPIVQSDRGGQVTFHGPGQLVAYVLFNLTRRKIGIRTFVCQLESVIIKLLARFKITGHTQQGAPGVYVDNKKIASIGLRVKNGYTYHGIALNVSMDLTPFSGINPCGYDKLVMTQLQEYIDDISFEDVQAQFLHIFLTHFGH